MKKLLYRKGTLVRVRGKLRQREESTPEVGVASKQQIIRKEIASPRRAVVFAPFFCIDAPASRPRFVASVLAELMPVDVVTSDFDHSGKVIREKRQCEPFGQVIYLKTLPYYSNVSTGRLISHLLFSFKAAAYFRKNRDKYDVVYATVPLNVMAWLVFALAGGRTKIIDVVDIWPDVLPFFRTVRAALSPIFAIWKWFFKSAICKADIVMAVSDLFADEAARCANEMATVKRFYIGQERLESDVPKQPIFTIAYVGNLGRLYDFDTLLDVVAEKRFRDCVQLYVIGKGDREEWLLRELERRVPHFRFFGAVFEPTLLADILRSCHVGFNGYVNTTAAFSYKATTYFAAGLPIINSMTGDMQNLVEEYGLGENYEGGNRKQLSDRLWCLCGGGTTAMAANCENFFASNLESGKIEAGMRDCLVAALDKSCCIDIVCAGSEVGMK